MSVLFVIVFWFRNCLFLERNVSFWGKGGVVFLFGEAFCVFALFAYPFFVFEFASVLIVFEFGLDFVRLFGGRRHVSFLGVLFVFALCSNSTF